MDANALENFVKAEIAKLDTRIAELEGKRSTATVTVKSPTSASGKVPAGVTQK